MSWSDVRLVISIVVMLAGLAALLVSCVLMFRNGQFRLLLRQARLSPSRSRKLRKAIRRGEARRSDPTAQQVAQMMVTGPWLWWGLPGLAGMAAAPFIRGGSLDWSAWMLLGLTFLLVLAVPLLLRDRQAAQRFLNQSIASS